MNKYRAAVSLVFIIIILFQESLLAQTKVCSKESTLKTTRHIHLTKKSDGFSLTSDERYKEYAKDLGKELELEVSEKINECRTILKEVAKERKSKGGKLRNEIVYLEARLAEIKQKKYITPISCKIAADNNSLANEIVLKTREEWKINSPLAIESSQINLQLEKASDKISIHCVRNNDQRFNFSKRGCSPTHLNESEERQDLKIEEIKTELAHLGLALNCVEPAKGKSARSRLTGK